MQNNILNTMNQKLKYFKTNYLLFTISLIFLIFSILLISLINNLNMEQITIKFSNFKIIFIVLISINISLSIISLLSTNFFIIKKIFVRKIIITKLISNFSIILLIITNIIIPLYFLIISQKTLSLLYGYYTLVPVLFSEIFLSIFLLIIYIILKINNKNNSDLNKNPIKINQDEFKSKFINSKNNFEKTFSLIEETMINNNNIYNSFKKGVVTKKYSKLKLISYLLYFLSLFLICGILFVINLNLNSMFSILIYSAIIFLILYSSKISYDLYSIIFIKLSTKEKIIHTYLPDLLILFFKKYDINYFYQDKIEKNNFIIETDHHYIKITEKNILLKNKNENSLDLSIIQNSLSSSYIFKLIKSIESYFLSSIWIKAEFNEITYSKFKKSIEFNSKGLLILQIISSISYIGLLTTIIDGGAYENK